MSDPKEPVVVYLAADPMDAGLVKSQLDSAGFFCEMLDVQNTSMTLGGGFSIGVRLVVPAEQAAEAREFLKKLGHR